MENQETPQELTREELLELLRVKNETLEHEAADNAVAMRVNDAVSDIARIPCENTTTAAFADAMFAVLSRLDRLSVTRMAWYETGAEEPTTVWGDEEPPPGASEADGSCARLPIFSEGRKIGEFELFFAMRQRNTMRMQKMLKMLSETISIARQRILAFNDLANERDKALAAEKAKSFFFSTVSHDIRTPLNAIVGFAEMLRLGIDDEEDRKSALDAVLVSSRTLLELINDVLDLSKLEAGRMEIVPESTDVGQLFRGVIAAFEVSVSKKDLKIVRDIEPMPRLKIDPQRIRQILFNLVGNAVKFTDQGFITITAQWRSGTFRFSVRDTGCGIAEEDLKHIADPYVQVGRGRQHGGTGLGLAICKQLVARMNGEIEVASGVGLGSQFDIIIPNVEADEEAPKQMTTTQRIRLTVSHHVVGVKRVLIADDSPVNLRVLKAMLMRFNVRDIETAENGRVAFEKLDADPTGFDLVLTDMWMPEMDGETLVRKLRADGRFNDLKVFVLTADVELAARSSNAGFTGVLLKPLTLEELGRVLV